MHMLQVVDQVRCWYLVPWRVLLLQTRNIQDDLKKFSTANMILVDWVLYEEALCDEQSSGGF